MLAGSRRGSDRVVHTKLGMQDLLEMSAGAVRSDGETYIATCPEAMEAKHLDHGSSQ